MTALQAIDVTVNIGSRTLVDTVSFSVDTGEWLCIVGPNGAGKSTLLKALVGLVPSTGKVHADDVDLRKLKDKDRACWISYVAQNPVVPTGMTVSQYVMLGRTAHLNLLVSESKHDRDVTDIVLDEIGLADLAHREVATLSGGERQRAAIARALTQTSPIMILDEPTTGLDLGFEQEVLGLLHQLRSDKQLTIVSTMHNLNAAATYSDRLAMLVNGHLVASGSAEEVLTAERIYEHYHANVEVKLLNGKPFILPQ